MMMMIIAKTIHVNFECANSANGENHLFNIIIWGFNDIIFIPIMPKSTMSGIKFPRKNARHGIILYFILIKKR